MKITKEKYNEVVICRLEGEIDISNSRALRQTFEDIIENNEKRILMDFSRVSFIDSSGLAILIEMYQYLKSTGGQLRFSAMGESVKNIFELLKLYKLFQIFDTQALALKDF